MNRIFVIAGPTAVGKTSIVRRLVVDGVALAPPSYTTRPPRGHEVDGVDYVFTKEDTFHNMRLNGLLDETAKVFGAWYGMSNKQIESAKERGNVVLVRDIQGKDSVLEAFPDAISIFILPPSIQVLKDRMLLRMGDVRLNKMRSDSIEWEIKQASTFDHQVVNDNLETTISEITAIMESQ